MASVAPKRRVSKTRRDKRRSSHWKLGLPGLSKCSNCGETKLPHRLCKACGFYDGRKVVEVAEDEK